MRRSTVGVLTRGRCRVGYHPGRGWRLEGCSLGTKQSPCVALHDDGTLYPRPLDPNLRRRLRGQVGASVVGGDG
jgi:hypothetical protein